MDHSIEDHADEFRKLALLLSEEDEALSADVVQSVMDPVAYVCTHAKKLRLRGISKPIDGLPWIALIDGLEKRGKLIELDWKESWEMFVVAVVELLQNEKASEETREALSS